MIAAIDATGWVLIITAIGAPQLLQMILQYRREQAKIKRDAATAEKVEAVRLAAEAVKLQLQESTITTGKTLLEIHSWVNSLMGAALQTIATLKREKAERTKDKADTEAAREAEVLYEAHMAHQVKLDTKK